MEMHEYIEEIKLELTGYIIELELPDNILEQVVSKGLREIQRYIDTTELMTVPFAPCIDLTDSKVSSVVKVYRTEGYTGDPNSENKLYADPMYAQM